MCENLHFPHLYPRTVLRQMQRGRRDLLPFTFIIYVYTVLTNMCIHATVKNIFHIL